MAEPPVITVTATVMDGQVVRWHRTVQAAATMRPEVSASRNGVAVHAQYLTDVPPEWVDAAKAAHSVMRCNRQADMRILATHINQGPSNGPLVPVEQKEA